MTVGEKAMNQPGSPSAEFLKNVKFYVVTAVIGLTMQGVISGYSRQVDAMASMAKEISEIRVKMDSAEFDSMRHDIDRNEMQISYANQQISEIKKELDK
jgi:hypothetical protein